jgi:hypothetical protein
MTQLQENWDEGWRNRWLTLGDPLPQVATGPGGRRAFWNHGDGHYASLGLTRDRWSAATGLGVEVDASTPVNRGQWQHWELMLWDVGPTEQIIAASSEAAFPPAGLGNPANECSVDYPALEGMSGLARWGQSAGGGATSKGLVGPWIRAPEWYRVRLQVLPDGRCGIAINGVPVWLSNSRMKIDVPLRLTLGTSSVGALILHGPLEVWQGVKSDIDWSVLDTRDGQPVPLPKRPTSLP